MFYKVDSRKRTYAEHWRIQSPNLGRFLVVALCKLLGIQRRCSFGIRRPEALLIHPTSEVPRPARERLAPTVGLCEEVGLAFRFYASVDATIGARAKAFTAALLREDGLSWATVLTVLVRGRAQQAKLNCFSLLEDGRYVVTSDHAWKLTPHPGDLVELLAGAPPEAVAARHSHRIRELRPVPVREEGLVQVILAREQRHVDYQVGRGVYVPMTGEEIERVMQRA